MSDTNTPADVPPDVAASQLVQQFSTGYIISSALQVVVTASGDFFEAVPREGDAYIMKHIIHDWDDERALVRDLLGRAGFNLTAIVPNASPLGVIEARPV